jgi:predicted secreted acid phosphatase
MQVGDSLDDFIGGTEGTPAERYEKASRQAHRWGVQWIILANPVFGQWKDAADKRGENPKTEGPNP